jgi:copper chaperone CopZ
MRRLVTLLGLAALVGAGATGCGSDCGAPSGPGNDVTRAGPNEEVVYLETKGVSEPERDAVAKALAAVEGVRTSAWAAEGTRVVRERGKAPDDALFAAAKAAGADEAVKMPIATASFSFDKPLHCAGCVKQVKTAVTALPGVKEIDVADSKKNVVVLYDARTVKPTDVEAALAAIKKPAKATPAP